MPIKSLSELYQDLDHPSLSNDQLGFILSLSEKDKEELSKLELEKMQNGEFTLLFRVFSCCHDATIAAQWTNVRICLDALKHLISLFSNKVLHFESQNCLDKRLVETTRTSLSMAIEYFINLYKNLPQSAQELKHRVALIKQCKNDLIDPLLAKKISVDKGFVMGRSILTICIEFVRFKPEEIYHYFCALFLVVLDRVEMPNRRSTKFAEETTPLSMTVRRKYPIDYVEQLFDKGADANLLYIRGLGSVVRSPLLNIIIEQRNYPLLAVFLERGADPNKRPECDDEYVCQYVINNDSMLTPYQLAVSMKDQQAISIIVEHARQKKIALIPVVHEAEGQRFTKKTGMEITGKELQIHCHSKLFSTSDSLLHNLQTRFNLKVFVKNESEKQITTEAVTWLLESAGRSSARFFWQPVMECLQEEVRDNQEFAIYVSEIPREVNKHPECAGLFLKDIHIQTGLPKDLLISVLAHELGHLYHHRKFPMDTHSKYSIIDKIDAFKAAVNADLAKIKTSELDITIGPRLSAIKTAYNEENKYYDYFTLIFVELPISYAYENPDLSGNDIFNIMSKYFPSTIDFYQQYFARYFAAQRIDKTINISKRSYDN